MMVIKMRVFYLFKIKEEFVSLYQETPGVLFQILRQLYYMHEGDLDYAFHLFEQLTEPISKKSLDRKIFLELHKNFAYTKSQNQHIINDLFHDEISILVVKRSHLLVTANKNFSSFFSYLKNKDANFFVCDFEYLDYFFLTPGKILA